MQNRELLRAVGGAAAIALVALPAFAREAPDQAEPPAAPEAPAAPETPMPTEADGLAYPVSSLSLAYRVEHPGLPPLNEAFFDAPVYLLRTPRGFVAPRPGHPGERLRLGDIGGEEPMLLYGSAVRAVSEAIRDELNRRGLIVVYVEPDPDDIDNEPPFMDLREDGTDLRMIIRAGVVREVGTVASGERSLEGERVNNPAHRWIRERSPVQPAGENGEGGLIRKDEVEEFVFRLNRHPGRQVGVAISAATAGEPGDVVLDYLVSESKPWSVYAQVSNTGTENTNEWRERFGFVHNQLTGSDDIFRLDYITAGFEDSHAVVGSYERPLFNERLRGRVFGSWSEFTASDVGLADEDFSGESWTVGGEALWNFFQRRELFLDLIAGARWQHVEVSNELLGESGEDGFAVPYAGVRLERDTQASVTQASVVLEYAAGLDDEEIERLGRPAPDDEWVLLTWDVEHSFYLEPLLNPGAWERRESWSGATLAHEFALSFRGQHALGYRLIPNTQDVLGGLFTVRGYPESIVAGDTVYLGTAEYRFHLPQALGVEEEPQTTVFGEPFRWRPQQPYGRADWDLILRAFVDYGRVEQSDRLAFESDETLVGTGVGVELQFRRNVSVRLDWGFALEDVNKGTDDEVESGDDRLHFVATLIF